MKKETKNLILRNIAVSILCVILGVIIALQYKAIDANSKDNLDKLKTLDQMKNALIQEQIRNDSLENELQVLTEKLKKLEASALDQQMSILKEEYDRAMKLAGLTDVKGKGVVITIGENPNISLPDYELVRILNDIKALDAQAISINNERIVAMTEIIFGELYINVNGKPISPPYVINVIGDPEKIERGVYMNGGIYDSLLGYGMFFGLERKENILIPKIKEDRPSIQHNLLDPV